MERETNIDIAPRSIIRINGQVHNLAALLKLLKQNGAKVNRLISQITTPGIFKKITMSYIPSNLTQLEVGLGYQETRKILESSREFRGFVDSILGEVVSK